MTDLMTFNRELGTGCSVCQGFFKLNRFGLCADCWSKLPPNNRDALTESAVRVVTKTVYNPNPRLLTVVAWAVVAGGLSAAGATWAVMHFSGLVR